MGQYNTFFFSIFKIISISQNLSVFMLFRYLTSFLFRVTTKTRFWFLVIMNVSQLELLEYVKLNNLELPFVPGYFWYMVSQ